MIWNNFGSVIYHKPNFILKTKYQYLYNKNIGIFSRNDTRISWYFMGMHRDLCMRKVLEYTISSAKCIIITTNNNVDKAVRYIHENKLWESFYVFLKIIFTYLRVLYLVDINNVGMEKVYYESRLTKKIIEKTIYDIDYQELFPDI